ncbi:glutathione S-transferase family protein [Hyphobacterium sp.]|uniref:glutathione S-transferase family protein n=1 Tax=Hyphobacterium sp. TaxID=2004662 RepID=UPI003B51CD38
MSLEFYHNPQSRAALTHWLLEEIGCDYEIKSVAYEDGSMRTPEFLAINPMGKIPAIRDGETIVTETTAIAIYLADKCKTPNNLAPDIDDPRRGEYLRWVAYQSAVIDPAMMQASTKVEIARQSAGWGDVDLVMTVLEDRLSRANPYLLGDWFTAADVLIGGALGWATQFGMFEMRAGFENYLKAVQSRPAFKKVFAG